MEIKLIYSKFFLHISQHSVSCSIFTWARCWKIIFYIWASRNHMAIWIDIGKSFSKIEYQLLENKTIFWWKLSIMNNLYFRMTYWKSSLVIKNGKSTSYSTIFYTELEDQDIFFTYNKVRKRKKRQRWTKRTMEENKESRPTHMWLFGLITGKNYYVVEMHGLFNKLCCINQIYLCKPWIFIPSFTP